jgi:hypothetical protein
LKLKKLEKASKALRKSKEITRSLYKVFENAPTRIILS